MKKHIIYILLVFVSINSFGQKFKKNIDANFNEKEAIADFKFLASDELMGRDPKRPEIDIAAQFIALQFYKHGAKEIKGQNSYFQNIPFRISSPPTKGLLTLGSKEFLQGEDVLVLEGNGLSGKYEWVAVGFGQEEDYANLDVKGKVVISKIGAPNRISPNDLINLGRQKHLLAQQKGAVALIELYNVPTVPWGLVANYLNTPSFAVDQFQSQEQIIPNIWLKDLSNLVLKELNEAGNPAINFEIEGKKNKTVIGKNVVAVIEGSDPTLKNEYVMLSAHYDHVGVGRPDAKGDSIYNGARDNAVGVVALINAARYFAAHPPKRSILLCAWTAEEKGLLGSAYFSENPLVPLDQIIYNLNIDNAGYNDTSIISVIGLGRTTGDQLIENAVKSYGLKAVADPAPEQNLYDRSDNVNFAKKGIPAPTFSLGFTAFDETIGQFYHQPGDEVESFDLNYAVVYWKSYLLSAQLIANSKEKPKWVKGDKYEEVGKSLYGN
jgi:hypothetical protein